MDSFRVVTFYNEIRHIGRKYGIDLTELNDETIAGFAIDVTKATEQKKKEIVSQLRTLGVAFFGEE